MNIKEITPEELVFVQNYYEKTIKKVLSGTKGKILNEILTQKEPSITSIALELNESKPNIAFHLNGNTQTPNGLIELGMVEKVSVKKGINILALTKFGIKSLSKILEE